VHASDRGTRKGMLGKDAALQVVLLKQNIELDKIQQFLG
jgi:hypothetical protein